MNNQPYDPYTQAKPSRANEGDYDADLQRAIEESKKEEE
eukprot:CAMPEP_0202969080 /NCGR_PEP_ID=MMETSP1396-20130829/14675_1 /ASSEMBLY_ACC=CAM_ASM_000872 /TAXON_ID= /ORGANISM="Pseudokeronopsis sp., Strain Brazil" /LENGTH=38 /DNA_ID= /DNA_START= /DNA_END= /DNA_ORIENTATION=